MMTPLYSSIIGCLLLLIGFGFGFTPYHPPYQVIHLSIGSIFFLMVPMMVYVHIQRFYIKGADDWVAWMHFVLFAVLLYIAVKMIRKWWPSVEHDHDH